jgi:hypothetical protein
MHPLLLLAQLTKDNSPSFLVFVGGASVSLFLINQALTFYKSHMKEQPAPAATYATKQELSRVEADMKESIGRLADAMTREVSSQAGKRKAIYEDLEQLGKDMAGLKADNTTQTRQLFNVESKVDRILERMPRS